MSLKNFAILTVIFIIMAASGCSKPSGTKLLISAAASLQDSLNELQPIYAKAHPDIKLSFNFGSSGALQSQIEQGAPADLFLSAGTKQMKTLVDHQLIKASEQMSLLSNQLVVVIPAQAVISIKNLQDLNQPIVRNIALGDPASVPAGTYAKQALNSLHLWDPLLPKIVLAKDARQVLTYVETGNTEAGFVYKTDALSSTKVKIAWSVDLHSHEPILYPMGIVKATKHAKEALDFYQFLQSSTAKQIFVKKGFIWTAP
jgi:molybdate transport system substrate-binding protein